MTSLTEESLRQPSNCPQKKWEKSSARWRTSNPTRAGSCSSPRIPSSGRSTPTLSSARHSCGRPCSVSSTRCFPENPRRPNANARSPSATLSAPTMAECRAPRFGATVSASVRENLSPTTRAAAIPKRRPRIISRAARGPTAQEGDIAISIQATREYHDLIGYLGACLVIVSN